MILVKLVQKLCYYGKYRNVLIVSVFLTFVFILLKSWLHKNNHCIHLSPKLKYFEFSQVRNHRECGYGLISGAAGCIRSTQCQKISFTNAIGVTEFEKQGKEVCSFITDHNLPASCTIEGPEHAMVQKFILPNSSVLEIGARFGTTSCEIAKKQNNSGRLVSVEPDLSVWSALIHNQVSHGCNFTSVLGVVGEHDLNVLPLPDDDLEGYARQTGINSGQGISVSHFTWDEVEMAAKISFDTILVDCEGCLPDILNQYQHKLKQINTLLLEADMPMGSPGCGSRCLDYSHWIRVLADNGLHVVDKIQDTGCCQWIYHYVFKRK